MCTRLYTCLLSLLMVLCLVVPVRAGWLGLELDTGAAGAYQAWGPPAGQGYTGLYEATARLMYQGQVGAAETELHLLAGLAGGSDGPGLPGTRTPFRSLDLKTTFREDGNPAGFSELDRLWLSLPVGKALLTAGRQAVTWGDAYFFNVADIFGAYFPTQMVRLHKPGIDALALALPTGELTALELLAVPAGDDGEDSFAANWLVTAGEGMVSIIGGAVTGEPVAGAGYTVDVRGTRLYLAATRTDIGREEIVQGVAGAERQLGEYTHLLAEAYYNSWGAGDPAGYPALLTDDRLAAGRVLSLGRRAAAVQVSRQMTPLVTGRAALFANLTDGSALLRMEGTYSASNLTDIWGGLAVGLGERPRGLTVGSEYGQAPVTLTLEIVHNLG